MKLLAIENAAGQISCKAKSCLNDFHCVSFNSIFQRIWKAKLNIRDCRNMLETWLIYGWALRLIDARIGLSFYGDSNKDLWNLNKLVSSLFYGSDACCLYGTCPSPFLVPISHPADRYADLQPMQLRMSLLLSGIAAIVLYVLVMMNWGIFFLPIVGLRLLLYLKSSKGLWVLLREPAAKYRENELIMSPFLHESSIVTMNQSYRYHKLPCFSNE